MKTLSIDIETYSSIDLTKSGVYKYTQNDFEILLIAYAYDDEDIKRLSMIMTLYETDFSKEDIDEYMQLILSGENDEECLKILSQKRKKTLDKIHILEKQISNLDYLKNEIKNNN